MYSQCPGYNHSEHFSADVHGPLQTLVENLIQAFSFAEADIEKSELGNASMAVVPTKQIFISGQGVSLATS